MLWPKLNIKKVKLFRSDYSEKSTPLPDGPDSESAIELKIQELISLLENSRLEKKQAEVYQSRISASFKKAIAASQTIRSFRELDTDGNLSREDLLEGLEKLLSDNPVDSKMSKSYLRRITFQKIVSSLLSLVLIVLGFAMIIMPAPQSFELYTVFYFTPDDGVTIMDLVSLLIILGGVILLVTNLQKK